MSDEGIELPPEWAEQGWTLETALADDEGNDSEWGTSVVIAAADPSEVQGEQGEEETAIG
jgi:hypothetical protein